ncbi:MAG TPA: hypothetical protein VHO47_02125 [Candidatus Babeliales bacterium]|nr:hypothetical protein [Candidatus Babeliales bacterium]
MKKIVSAFLVIFLASSSLRLQSSLCDAFCMQEACYMAAFSSGYVFKQSDHTFNQVYGPGMGNIVTADFSYHRWRSWALGAKVSYWLAVGHTTFFKRRTFLQEVPVTFYLRKIHDFKSGLRLYASLGGGFVWIGEESYLGHSNKVKGIGEAEIGFNYPVGRCLNFTTAFRYLFPRQSNHGTKMNVGGLDLRGGVGVSF